ncbi:hypothetical protein QQZ08_005136 [Neonectria magnoliae]|uniref:Uncharacterized protein n=1 Tax=Neonectria magnoliae TaxID=2732573 RepID=A0ABR1I4B0_9HYPO
MAGSVNTTTLRRVLTQSKPPVPCKTRGNKNTMGASWPNIDHADVKLWSDFTLENLNAAYGHILDHEISAEQLAGVPRAEHVIEGIEMHKSTDILHLVGWNDRLLRPTLALAKQHLNLHPGVQLEHITTGVDQMAYERVQIDHQVALDEFPLPNLVVGLGRLSRNFQARQLIDLRHPPPKEGFWPLRQLANICHVAKTRYGAAHHGPRALMPERDVVGIGEWEPRQVDEVNNRWVRRHRYSSFEEPTDPPPPPAYQDLTPGIPAGFAANFAMNPDGFAMSICPASNQGVDVEPVFN